MVPAVYVERNALFLTTEAGKRADLSLICARICTNLQSRRDGECAHEMKTKLFSQLFLALSYSRAHQSFIILFVINVVQLEASFSQYQYYCKHIQPNTPRSTFSIFVFKVKR